MAIVRAHRFNTSRPLPVPMTRIYLAGGGSLLRGLDKRISDKTTLKVHIAEDPLKAVARGTAIALKNFDKFPFLMR